MKQNLRALVVIFLGLWVATGCKPSPPPSPSSPPELAEKPVPAPEKKPRSDALAMEDRVLSIVRKLGTRQACNRLTGCSLPQELGRLGPKSSKAIQALYLRTPGDALGRIKLVEAVGLTHDPNADDFLLDVLQNDRLPPARVEAAFALARLGKKEHILTLSAHAAALKSDTHRPILLAIGYALARLGDPSGVPMIEANFQLPGPKARRWDPLRPGIRAAGNLRLRSLAPRLMALTKVNDPYIRRESIAALAQMRSKEAIPHLIERLTDEMPFVRREALQSLKHLTGFQHKSTPDQWKRWWKKQTSSPEAAETTDG